MKARQQKIRKQKGVERVLVKKCSTNDRPSAKKNSPKKSKSQLCPLSEKKNATKERKVKGFQG